MVVWMDGRFSFNYRIYAARVTPSGSVLDPNGIPVGPANNMLHYYPAIAFDGTRFLVVWSYHTSPYTIMGRFINTDGTLSDTFVVATPTSLVSGVKIVFNGTNYFVNWLDYVTPLDVIRGLRLTTSGVPIGSPFTILSDLTNYPQNYPIALRWDGHNYLATGNRYVSSTYQVYGQFCSPTGTLVGSPFRISNSSNNHSYADMIPGANSRYLNVWSEYPGSSWDISGNLDVLIPVEEQKENSMNKPVSLVCSIVRDAIQLDNANGIKTSIFDITGRKVGTTTNGYFSCSNLSEGVYFVSASNSIKFKVIKVK